MFQKNSRSSIQNINTLLDAPLIGIDRSRRLAKNLTLGEIVDVVFVTEAEKTEVFMPDGSVVKTIDSFPMDFRLFEAFQIIRDELGKPVYPTSSYRSYDWEIYKGRSGSSQHTLGRALDLRGDGLLELMADAIKNKSTLFNKLKAVGVNGFGVYKSKNFVHIDTRPAKPNNGSFFFGDVIPEGVVADDNDSDANEKDDNNTGFFSKYITPLGVIAVVPFGLLAYGVYEIYKRFKN